MSALQEPVQIKLDSGYTLLRWNEQVWAQIPSGFTGEVIPDEHIFNPAWNRETVNRWWREGQSQ